jgi:hypothetical protein
MKVFYADKTGNHYIVRQRISVCLYIFLALIFFSVCACTQTDEFKLGMDFIESQTNVQVLDTFKVDISTILLDSLPTSGTGVVFVGSYKDNEIGSINVSSYFEPGFPDDNQLEDVAIYDSASFILTYSGYSFGDTTAQMSLSIYQLSNQIALNESGYLYNNSSVSYSPSVLGTKIFYPQPKSADTIVTVPVYEFGRKLFVLFNRNDENISTAESFLNYLKGFVITSTTSANAAIIGFIADENHLLLRIYYHYATEAETTESNILTIPFGNTDVQFNQIQNDFSGTKLSNIRRTNNVVPSSEIGDKAYMMGLIGLLPKVQFPTLQDIMLANRWKILKAELIFAPVKTSYDIIELPKELYLYDTDKHNLLNSQLFQGSSYVVSSLNFDELYKEDTRYTFDITSFINSELSDSYFDYEHGILVGLNYSDIQTTFGRLLLESKNPAVKLRLYYLTY